MVDNIIKKYNYELENTRSFKRVPTPDKYNSIGTTWELSNNIGEGYYWIYAKENLFAVKIHDFFYYKDTFLAFDSPKCLSISEYYSISGEELNPYRKLNSGCIKTFIGSHKLYRMIVHKNIPIKSIGIEIMPEYYEKYLKKHYRNQYIHPLESFQSIDQVNEFLEIQKLFFELRNYKENNGLSSHLFYESKVNECISLVLSYSNRLKQTKSNFLSNEDIEALNKVIDYINDHYAFDIPLKKLSDIAFMGTTKLKSSFKQYKYCTITEYIQAKRMAQAKNLIIETDLSINEIAKKVGYSTSSRFANLFKKNTGLLPSQYRKIGHR